MYNVYVNVIKINLVQIQNHLHCLKRPSSVTTLRQPVTAAKSPATQMSSESEPPSSTDKQPESAEGVWKLHHVKGDLFSCQAEEALAHCISEDCRMGAGIAVMFKKNFGGVDELKKQKKITGQCAVLRRGKRFVYYLITKKVYSHKPTNESLKMSLEDMRSHCSEHGVTRLSMPRIGCGLDRLKWEEVTKILTQVFQDTDIHITVYTLPEKPQAKGKPHISK